MRKEAVVLVALFVAIILLLAACEGRKPTTSAPPAQNVKKTANVTNVTAIPSGNLTGGNLTGAINASKRLPCTIAVDDIVELCTLQRKPKEAAPCFFELSRQDFGEGAGNVTVEMSIADFNDYNRSVLSIPGSTITKDPKPYGGYNEVRPFKYFWWWTGEKLVAVKATSRLCTIDEMKQLSLRAGQR